jgi:Flp pilus assembly protein TadD
VLSGGPFFRAPLYPYFLAIIYTVFGTNFVLVFLIQHIIGVAAIFLAYFVARELFPPLVAYGAAFLMAINGVLIFFEGQLLLDFLTVDFCLLIVYFLILARKKNSDWHYLGAGIFVGLFAITRPNILGVIPLFIIWMFLDKQSIRIALRKCPFLLAGAALIIMPVTARNLFIGHDQVLIASQGGINFYIGNNEKADGYTALLPGKGHTWQYSDAEFEAATDMDFKPGTLKPSQVSDYYYQKSFRFIFDSPDQFIKLMVKKVYLFWNYFEISNNNSLYFITGYIGLKFIPLFLFAIIGPLGFVGAIICFKKDKKYWLLPLTIFGYMFTVVAYFVTDRFRLPVVPLLSITAPYAVYEIVLAVRHNKLLWPLILAGSILFAGIFSWSDFYHHHDTSNALAYYSLGNVYLKKGDYKSAQTEFLEATRLAPCVPHAHTNLGVIAFYRGDTAAARLEFEKEIASCGPSGKAYNNRSLLKRLGVDFKAAYAIADTASKTFPNYKETYINRILAAFGANDTTLIGNATSDFVEMFPEDIGARYYQGLYLRDKGEFDSAAANFQYAATASSQDLVSEYDLSEIYSAALPYGYNPQKIRGRSFYQLGLLEAQSGNIQTALDFFARAVALLPDDADARANLALAYDQMGELQIAKNEFQKAIALDSTKGLYYYNYALTLGKMGDLRGSESMLAKAVQIIPEFALAKSKLKTLREYLSRSSP